MSILDEVKKLVRTDRKIMAIRILRKNTGLGLAEAKQIIDTIVAGGEVELWIPTPVSPNGENREQRIRWKLEALSEDKVANVLDEQEIGKLLKIIQEDEKLLAVARAKHNFSSGSLVATKKRLLFMDENVADPISVKEFPLGQIYLLHHKSRPLDSSIKIFMKGYKREEFTNMEENTAQLFERDVIKHIKISIKDDYGYFDPWDELEHMEALYNLGIITSGEWAKEKQKFQVQIQQQETLLTKH